MNEPNPQQMQEAAERLQERVGSEGRVGIGAAVSTLFVYLDRKTPEIEKIADWEGFPVKVSVPGPVIGGPHYPRR